MNDSFKNSLAFLPFAVGLSSVGLYASPVITGKPNVIIILCDDTGYGDLACYGSVKHRTPNLDKMAQEGIRFTDFYVTCGVCTPSRSSLMTGCYPIRIGMNVNAVPFGKPSRQVLFPVDRKGLNPNEITIAEILKDKGYTTACIGKWHLGDQSEFLPTRQGFDYYFGIPYSNDMDRPECPLPLMRNEKVIEAPADQNTLTKRYTEEAIQFIRKNRDKPFFIYLPHAMTHNPLHTSDAFRGRSANGIYGDAVEELDWSTGEILKELKKTALDERTLVIFTSDNGAAPPFGGSNLPLSGWKGSTMEGGMREPCIMRWPGVIPAGQVCSEMVTTMEILPTVAKLVHWKFPDNRIIDGLDMFKLMTNPGTKSPRKVFFYYQLDQLQAVRSGTWKLHLPLDSVYTSVSSGRFGPGRSLKLIDLGNDPEEKTDVSAQHPEMVKRLLKFAASARKDLGDIHQNGKGTRKPGLVNNPRPQLMKK